MRKGRSVVHTNLEDNYGAVIVANHEALVQVLDQVGVFVVLINPNFSMKFLNFPHRFPNKSYQQ